MTKTVSKDLNEILVVDDISIIVRVAGIFLSFVLILKHATKRSSKQNAFIQICCGIPLIMLFVPKFFMKYENQKAVGTVANDRIEKGQPYPEFLFKRLI